MSKTLEDRIKEWEKQPGAFTTENEWRFITTMRYYADLGLGYGWMQQVIEWEWASKGIGAWGPEYHGQRILALEEALREGLALPRNLTSAHNDWHARSSALLHDSTEERE